ncbi:uncharacterized protein LOC131997318 isoform X2 [Stomoxys calcitrans]|uniref:uncharacterized protein LOC131997318 isoform X2 n=1 Tax=Stomoxys calcitrans TaxID=35570 RepID=UPI0027E38AA2|nr:uncharacterized protein LOC131997318 isoform X2 [Stomoxys calcitrans]
MVISRITTAIIKRKFKMRVRDIYTCMLCKMRHSLRYCPKFVMMSVSDRRIVIRKFKYCINCLARSHTIEKCHSEETCRKCRYQHHTMLHPKPTREPKSERSTEVSINLRSRLGQQSQKVNKTSPQGQQRSTTLRKTKQQHSKVQKTAKRYPKTRKNNLPNIMQPDPMLLSEAIKSLASVLCASSVAQVQGRRHGQN